MFTQVAMGALTLHLVIIAALSMVAVSAQELKNEDCFYTQKPIGSIYNDGKLIARGFKGEQLDWSDNRTVGIKIHQYGSASKLAHKMHKTAGEVFPKTLLIVRSPFKAIFRSK